MERLQVAIEKARAQRDGTDPDRAEAEAPVQGKTGEDKARKASAPLQTLALTADAQVDQTRLWHALRPLDMSGITRGSDIRITTLKSGSDSAPFDMLRTRILHQAQTHGWKRIAVTSPHAGCGKTLTTANLAFSFARQAEMRTMVFDFDMRRPGLAKVLMQKPTATMGDVLDGRVPFAQHALRHGDNLAFALNARPVANSAELLHSTSTRDQLARIQAEYQPDIMLFDMPPLRSTDDSIGFLRFVDAAIIIVAAEQTPMAQIDVAERQVAELTNVMGVVLNKCRIMDGEYGYETYGS